MRNVSRAALANAFIWVSAILAAAVITRGTPEAGILVTILGGAAGASIIVVGKEHRTQS